tara:strand:+ start:210 stop:584 length:375 start_codon:yes stop_codon:yes gene_type:complete
MNLDKPTYITAIKSLVGGNIGGYNDGPIEKIKFFDGQTPPTEEEIQAKIAELEAAEPLRLLRIQRNQLLQESDWVTIKAYSQGVEVSAEWKTYLQALRDLPTTAEPQLDENGQLTNVTWPEVPE